MKTKTETLTYREMITIERALRGLLKCGEVEHASLEALYRKVRAADKFKLVTTS